MEGGYTIPCRVATRGEKGQFPNPLPITTMPGHHHPVATKERPTKARAVARTVRLKPHVDISVIRLYPKKRIYTITVTGFKTELGPDVDETIASVLADEEHSYTFSEQHDDDDAIRDAIVHAYNAAMHKLDPDYEQPPEKGDTSLVLITKAPKVSSNVCTLTD